MNSKYIVMIAFFAVGTLSHGMQQLQSMASQEVAINGVEETQASKKRRLEVGSESHYQDYSEDAVIRQLGAVEAPPELVIGDISEPEGLGLADDFFSASNSNASTDPLRDCEALDSSMSDVQDVPNLELGDVQEQIIGELPQLLPAAQLAAAPIDDSSSSSSSNAGALLAAATVASQDAGSQLGKRKKPSPNTRAPEAPKPSASRGSSESSSSESDYSKSESDSDDDYKMTERRKPASKSKKMNKKVFPCTHTGCLKTLTSKHSLLGHLQSHARKEKTFKCEHHGCGKIYKTEGNFKNHLLSHMASSSSSSNSNENAQGTRSYKCTEAKCGAHNPTLESYKKHMDAHGGLKKYKDWYKQSDEGYICIFAGCSHEPFKSIGNLSNHLRSHDPKLVNSSGGIKTTIVNGKKRFVCDELGCGEDFSTNMRLQAHRAQHGAITATGVMVNREKNGYWRCLFPGCKGAVRENDGLFNKLGNLAAHVKTHVGEGNSASNSSSSSSASSSATAMEEDVDDQDE